MTSTAASTHGHRASVIATLKQRLVWAVKGKPRNKKQALEEMLRELEPSPATFLAEYRRLCEIRQEKCVPVTQPLALISQIQRSGGTLLSQLFDAHPQCHAHPFELYVGFPKKLNWPALDLQAKPDAWFRILFEKPVMKSFREGYTKYAQGALEDEELDVYPFVFLPAFQKRLFLHLAANRPITTARDVFDCYFTSYFNAWLDNQNLYTGPKRLVTAFVPRMGMDGQNLRRFFDTYVDGRLISIVRDPRSWYVSARKHKPEIYGPIEEAVRLWKESTQAIVAAREARPDAAYVMSFEELVGETEPTMRHLAAWLGIDFHPALLTPTFNHFPIKADSSFKVQSHGVIQDPLHRYKKALTPAEIAYVEGETGDLHARALELRSRAA